MSAQIKQTGGICQNLIGTLGFAEIDANGQVVYSSLTDFLRKQMDMLYSSVNVGDLLKKYSGKGEIFFRDKKQIYPIEFIDADIYVGKVWYSGLSRYVNTKRFVIRYSKDGVYLHPVKERE